jgi:ribonuclease HI
LIALNTDGSVVEHDTKAACGGVMRDCNGNFLVAYVAHIHPCLVLEAELWGIYYGLKTAWSRGYRRIKVVSDSLSDINLLKDGCPPTHPLRMLVENIHQIHRNSGLVV